MNTLATITGGDLGSLFLQLVIVGLIAYVLWWALGKIALPEPFNKILMVLLVVGLTIYLVNLLASLGGHPFISW